MLKNNKLSLQKDIIFLKKSPDELLEYIVTQYNNNKIVDVDIETIDYLMNNRTVNDNITVNNNITVKINEILNILNNRKRFLS